MKSVDDGEIQVESHGGLSLGYWEGSVPEKKNVEEESRETPHNALHYPVSSAPYKTLPPVAHQHCPCLSIREGFPRATGKEAKPRIVSPF